MTHWKRDLSASGDAATTHNAIAKIAQTLKATRDLILIASGINPAIALEGALKLKEATDTHAEFLTIVPLQRMAYELAILREIDVDRPRNITKSLTT